MPVTIPFTFIGGPGNKAKASEVNANFAAVASKFTELSGGIADADVYSFADLNCNKLSSSAGKRLISSKFEVGAVDSAALKADIGAGSPLAAVGTSNHIKDGIVTKNKLKIRFEEQVLGATAIGVGLTKEIQTTYPSTTDFFLGAYIVYNNNALTPSGAGPALTPTQARKWIKTTSDVAVAGVGTNWVWFQIVNTHATSTIDLGAGTKIVFVFLQN